MFRGTETEKRYGSQLININNMINSGTADDLFCARTILKSMLRTEYLYRYVGNSKNATTEYALIDELVNNINLKVGVTNTITNDLVVKTNAGIDDEGGDESDGGGGGDVIRERSDYGDSSEDIGEPPENSEDIDEEDDYGEQEGEVKEEIDSDISDDEK